MQIVINGLLINYEQSGSGTDIVMLHGWADSHTTFRHLTVNLKKDYRVTALDLPGFGQSQMPEKTWGLDEFAGFVANFIEKLQLKPYALFGHSNGGAIIIRGVARGMISPQKLILLASSGVREKQRTRKSALMVVSKIGKVVAMPLPQQARDKLRRSLYKAARSDMLAAKGMEDSFKRIVADDVRADAATIKTSTLLIYGNEDTETPPSQAEALSDTFENDQLVILANAGHFVHHDQTERVLKEIREFLK